MPDNRITSIEIPLDRWGNEIRDAEPSGVVLARTYDASISASTEIELNAATSALIVEAITNAVFLKWGEDDVTSSNYDAFIPANQRRILKVPAGTTHVNLIEAAASAAVSVVEK